MKSSLSIPSLLSFLAIQSCVTPGSSVTAGAGTGAALGGLGGYAVSQGASPGERNRQAAIGAGAGAVLGGITGYVIHNELKDRDQKAYEQGVKEGKKTTAVPVDPPSPPMLVPAQTDAVWIDDQVRGSTYTPGHYEYRIREKAHWVKQ